MSYWGQVRFQDAVSFTILQLIKFHDHAMVVLVIIMTFVRVVLIFLIKNKFIIKIDIRRRYIVETVWTLMPAGVLLALGLPSLRLLYLLDETIRPDLSVKAVGRQWYWTYEYDDFKALGGPSYIVPVDELNEQMPFRLIEVDNRLLLPGHTNIRVLVTATDVIHSWAVPRLGLKVDAVPGRLNQLTIIVTEPGVYYGFCSEICGANHSFMPIGIEVHEPFEFLKEIIKCEI